MSILIAISFLITIVGAVIITWGVLSVIVEFLLSEYNLLTKKEVAEKSEGYLRHKLGKYILLGLEFMVAGDIIHTALRPSKEELIILGSIVAIRTVISYFLNKELKS